jgi:acyl-CoA reductase-like NAD-dependent aldehyde dehydrogenase
MHASETAPTTRRLQIRNPRNGENDYEIEPPDADDLARIAADLRAAQPAWSAIGASERTRLLQAWVGALMAEPGPLVEALSKDTGRHLIALAELYGLPGMVERWAEAAPRLLADENARASMVSGVAVQDQLIPLPLVGVISPWNFPLLLSMIDAIPALAAGSAVLVKPSEVTPRFVAPLIASIQKVPELARVFKFVVGDGETGATLVEHVDAIAFTGSVRTGRLVGEACARHFIPCFLELGGKDPCIVLPDADVADAARIVLRASVQATGQACQSLERVYVHADQAEAFAAELARQAEQLQLNYPDIHQGHIGPLIFGRQAQIISAHLEDALGKGARLLTGGEIEHHGGGDWIRPTVLVDVDHSMQVMRDETFGPVMPVMAYQDLDEAVRLANDSEYGLSAAVIGGDTAACEAIARQLNAGAVSIHDAGMTTEVHDAAHDAFGYSGMGISRMGESGLLRYLKRKSLMVRETPAKGMDSLDEALAGGG